jgi:ribosome-associated heat shock protein Hsp15
MRLDVYLNKVCILKSRTLAKEACDRGKVTVNGEPAKGSQTVRVGDRIALDLVVRRQEFAVVAVPAGNVPKKRAAEYYEVLRDERVEPD